IGATLGVSASPGVEVRTDRFAGRFRDLRVAPGLRWQLTAGRYAAVALLAGLTGQFTVLDGLLSESATPSTTKRFIGSIDAGALVDFEPSRGIHLGLAARATYLSVYQRYLVAGHPVFGVWPVTVEVGGLVGVTLF